MKTIVAVLLALTLSATFAVAGTTIHVTREPLFRSASVAALRLQELNALSFIERSHPGLAAQADSDQVEAASINRLLNLVGNSVVKQGEDSTTFNIDRGQFVALVAVLDREVNLYALRVATPGLDEEDQDFSRRRLDAFRELAAEDHAILSTQP